jgi:phage-related baseplate assembly protein
MALNLHRNVPHHVPQGQLNRKPALGAEQRDNWFLLGRPSCRWIILRGQKASGRQSIIRAQDAGELLSAISAQEATGRRSTIRARDAGDLLSTIAQGTSGRRSTFRVQEASGRMSILRARGAGDLLSTIAHGASDRRSTFRA